MYTLKAIVDDLEGIPEQYHELYDEKDGKYVLRVDNTSIREHPHVTSLKNALDRTQKEAKEARDKLTAANQRLEGVPEDFDPGEFARLLAEEQSRRDNPNQADQQLASQRDMYEERLRQAGTKHTKDLETRETRIAHLTAQIDGRDKDSELDQALASVGIKKEFLPAVRALLRPQVRLERHDGDERPEIYFDTDMGRQPVAQYVGNWVQTESGRVYVAPASGGDANGTGDRLRPGAENPFRSDNGHRPNLTKQQEMIRKNPALARRMAQAAGVNLPAELGGA